MAKKKIVPAPPPPLVNESLEEYFRSPSYLSSFKRLTISSPEVQENANRLFSASLTPLQRLEYLFILNNTFLAAQIKKLPLKYSGKIHFEHAK